MLTTLKVWDEKGVGACHAAAIQTWPKAKPFSHYYKRLEDKQGNNYYVSHPPFAFLANYCIIKCFGLSFDQKSLQAILIFLLLAGSLLLAWIVQQIALLPDKRSLQLSMLAAMAFYLLNPVNLYAHSQHNFSEIWGQFFLIASLAAWVFYLRSDRVILSRFILLLSVALLSATDWMGLTFAAALLLIYARQLKKPHIRYGVVLVCVSVLATMGVIFIQYVRISGFDSLYRALGIRYLERSGFFGEQYTDMGLHILNPDTWWLFLGQIHKLLTGPGYIVLAMALMCLFVARKHCFTNEPSVQKIAFWTALLFFAAVFSAGSIHYIYTARFAPFIAIAGAALLSRARDIWDKPAWITGIFIFLMHLAAFWSVKTFHKSIPETDFKQAQLDATASVILELKRDSVPLQDGWEERDIIYLSYKSERNLVWEKPE